MPFTHYYRARQDDRLRQSRLTRAAPLQHAFTCHNEGGGVGSGGLNMWDSESDLETGSPTGNQPANDLLGSQGSEGGGFALFIHPPECLPYTVDATEGMFVRELRDLVDVHTPPHQGPWRLSFSSQLLNDDHTLGSYRLGQGNTITINGRVRGGGGPNSSKGGWWSQAQWSDATDQYQQWTNSAGAAGRRDQWEEWDPRTWSCDSWEGPPDDMTQHAGGSHLAVYNVEETA